MTTTPPADRTLRVATSALGSLTLLTYLGPLLDYLVGVQAFLGRINNLSTLTAGLFLCLVFIVPSRMRGLWERRMLLALGALFSYAVTISGIKPGDVLVTFGGLSVLLGALAAGLVAYVLGKSGKGLHNRIVLAVAASLPALGLPIAMIAWDPSAYPSFMIKVYGYSNIRVFGYFAAACTVVLAALTAPAWASRRASLAALQAGALTLSWSFLFWSGGRAGLLATALALPISWLITRRTPMLQIALAPTTALAGAGLSLLYHTPGKWFGLANRTQETLQKLEEGGLAKASSNRLDMWAWALERIGDHPLAGHGYLPMSRLRTESFNYFHSHNLVLEYWLSFGLIAGSLMLALGAAVYGRAALAARRNATPTSLALLMLATLLPIYAMFSATLFFPYHLMIFTLSCGALIGLDIPHGASRQAAGTAAR